MTQAGSGFSCLASLSQAPLMTSFSSFPFMIPVPLLYPQVPHNNSLTKTSPSLGNSPHSPFLWIIRTCPFKRKPSEDPEAKQFPIFQGLDLKFELKSRIFPKKPNILTDLLRNLIKSFQSEFSDLVSVSFYAVKARPSTEWKLTNWENSKRFLELQLGDQSTNLYTQAWANARQLHQMIGFFNIVDGSRFAHKNLMNVVMNIIMVFKSFLLKILIFLQMFILLRKLLTLCLLIGWTGTFPSCEKGTRIE